MYQNASQAIPLSPPVHLLVTLRPWFDNKCLKEGLELIREGRIQHFFFHRHIAAALLDGQSPLSIVFAATSTIKQGFTLKEHSCKFCGQRAAMNRCPHLAALTILSITAREEDEKNLIPMPLHFNKTGWYQIGLFLYSWLGQQSGKILSNISSDTFQLKKESEQSGISIKLPLNMTAQWHSFFTKVANSPEEEALNYLQKNIKEQSLTATETQMLSMGSETRGSKCDASVWIWICRYFALRENSDLPMLHYNNEKQMIVLTTRQGAAELILTLPKNRTWELLSSLQDYGLDIHILPPAQECFQVNFLPTGVTQVIPSLRLSDNSLVPRRALKEQKMGSHYFLPGEGFLR